MVGYINDINGEPVSRTHQYRKVMKPLLERKRRARINRCLDELKDLMTSTFQAEGENVAKLEKADILELTVRHLQKIQQQKPDTYVDKFKAGFRQCASEVTQFLGTTVGVDSTDPTTVRMLHHMQSCVSHLERLPGSSQVAAPPSLSSSGTSSGSPAYANSVGSRDDEGDEEFDEEYEYDEPQPQKPQSQPLSPQQVKLTPQQQQHQQYVQHQQQILLQQQHQQYVHHQQLILQQQQQHQLLQQQRTITPPLSPVDSVDEVNVDSVDDDDEDVAQSPPKKAILAGSVKAEDDEKNVWRPF